MKPAHAQPLYFGSPHQPLFGWFHPAPSGAPARIGLVLCYPFGSEAVCVHRSYRQCAQRVAAAGIPALRFDYPGTGDSAGGDTEPDQLAAWIASVRSAIATLRRHAGVEQVCLLGTRLGATIATLAAQDCADVNALIAVAPVVSGRKYLRELRALALARPRSPPPSGPSAPLEMLEAGGFAMSMATQMDLAAIDLLQIDKLLFAHACILERNDLPNDDSLAQYFNSLGIDVTRKVFTGFVEMMQDPHDAVVSLDLLDSVLAWLKPLTLRPGSSTARAAVSATQHLTTGARMHPIRETAVFLDDAQTLFGIVSEADTAPDRANANHDPVLLLTNSGSVHHIGPNRLYVTLARALAAQGVRVVRMDIGGIGDSDAARGQIENAPYPRAATEDIAHAASYARSALGATDLHLAGICSGGYHCLKAAARGVALSSITVINPLVFFWKEGMSLAQPDYQVTAETLRYRSRILQLAAWLKLLRGRVDVGAGARVLFRQLGSRLAHRLRELGRWLRIPLSNDLAAELRSIARRGTQIRFVFASSDPGRAMLLEQGGRCVKRLQQDGSLGIELIDGADHTFTAGWTRERLLKLLSDHFARHAAPE